MHIGTIIILICIIIIVCRTYKKPYRAKPNENQLLYMANIFGYKELYSAILYKTCQFPDNSSRCK